MGHEGFRVTLTANPAGQCKVCDRAFLRFRSTQAVCGPTCARKSVNADKKAEKEQTRARRMAVKSMAELLRTAQRAFNRAVRARDAGKPCIACGGPIDGIAHASHYLSVGSHPNLRFSEDNCHSGCVKCNVYLHGNLRPYRENLIARRGLAVVEALEASNGVRKYTRDEVIELTKQFNASAKQLEERNAH